MTTKEITVPFMGSSEIIRYSIEEVLENLDMRILFRSRWKMNRGGQEMLRNLLEDERVLRSMQPQAVYGYFPVYREGRSLIVDRSVRWEFPEIRGVTMADHFKARDEGGDIIPLTAVTVGQQAVSLSKTMYAGHDYAEYFLLYGLAAECTETLAAMINDTINVEMGLSASLRRSFGYPACPDLSYQRALLSLLKAERISLHLSSSNQLVPEFSTTAFIIHSNSKGSDHE